VKPFYFGSAQQPLFGAHHPPRGAPRDSAVLLCYPLPQEYGSVHWAFRRLAMTLALRGFHVLRFDYRGTGDSSGDAGDATFESMVESTKSAVEELRDVSGARRVSVVGMRFGAAVAARLPSTHLREVVLWEPILSGREHLEELRRVHRARELGWLLPAVKQTPGEPEDLLGYSLHDGVRRSVDAVDLRTGPYAACAGFSLVVSADGPEARALEAALAKTGARVQLRIVADGGAEDASKAGAALLSNAVLGAVADAVAGPSAKPAGTYP